MQSADVIVMSHTNSNLPYGTQRGHNCNPFGNVATVSVMQTSFTVSVISFISHVTQVLDIFSNDENLQVANWQIDTNTLIATIKAKSQNFSQGLGDCTKRISMTY